MDRLCQVAVGNATPLGSLVEPMFRKRPSRMRSMMEVVTLSLALMMMTLLL
jgi:hypothetical protein